MPAEILITLRERDLGDVKVILVLALVTLVCVALYSTWPEWRWNRRRPWR